MTQDKLGNEVTVRPQPEKHRFTLTYPGAYPGDELAGFTEFLDRGKERIFYHTEVNEAFAGRGLASILVAGALEATTAEGKEIVAVCPFVASYLDKHGHGGPHRRPTRADLAWVREQLGQE